MTVPTLETVEFRVVANQADLDAFTTVGLVTQHKFVCVISVYAKAHKLFYYHDLTGWGEITHKLADATQYTFMHLNDNVELRSSVLHPFDALNEELYPTQGTDLDSLETGLQVYVNVDSLRLDYANMHLAEGALINITNGKIVPSADSTATEELFWEWVLNSCLESDPDAYDHTVHVEQYVNSDWFKAHVLFTEHSNSTDERYYGLYSNGEVLEVQAHARIDRLRARSLALHPSPVGFIVEGMAGLYGADIPDNLHPCDGTLIDHPLAHVSMKNKLSPNAGGRVSAASGSYVAGYKYGASSYRLTESNIPKISWSFPQKSYNFSGNTGSMSTNTDSDNKVWTFDPDQISTPWEGGGGIDGSSTHYYPRLFSADNDRDLMTLNHKHSFSGSVKVDGQSFTYGENTAQSISLSQPTIVVDKYIVIY